MPLSKISLEQRHQLIQIFVHMGTEEAQRECVKLGLHPHYARTQAYEISAVPPKTRR